MTDRLRVIEGGEKPDPLSAGLRAKTHAELMSEHLFAVLPALNRRIIAERLSERLQRPVQISEVDWLLNWVRKNSDRLRWLPFYAPRGRNVAGEDDRFIVVQLDRDGLQHTTEEGGSCDRGTLSMLRVIATTADRNKVMLLALAGRTTGRKRPRMLRNLAADLEFVVRKLGSMAEEVAEDDHRTA